MKHLKNAEILSELKKRDSHLLKVIKSDLGRLEEFFKKSTFARILDAVLNQIYDVSRRDSIQAELCKRFGLTYGPADPLPYLHKMLIETQKKALMKREIEALELLIQVCYTALGTLNLDGRPFEDMPKLVIENLSKLKGIHPTTVIMMQMNAMTDLDICPVNDPKLNEAVRYLYGGKSVREVSDRWAPYKSIVCWYIWEYQRRRTVRLLNRSSKKV